MRRRVLSKDNALRNAGGEIGELDDHLSHNLVQHIERILLGQLNLEDGMGGVCEGETSILTKKKAVCQVVPLTL